MKQFVSNLNDFTHYTNELFKLIPNQDIQMEEDKLMRLSTQYKTYLCSALAFKRKLINEFMHFTDISSMYIAILNIFIVNLNGQLQIIERGFKRHNNAKNLSISKVNFL